MSKNYNIDSILLKYESKMENLLNILHDLQNSHPQNFLTQEAIEKTAKFLNSSLSSVYGFAKYYSMLSTDAKGKFVIRICSSPICFICNACGVRKYISKRLNITSGETTADGLFTLETVECLGHCDKSPCIMINDVVVGNLSVEKAAKILDDIVEKSEFEYEVITPTAEILGEKRFLFEYLGKYNPTSLKEYLKIGGMQSFEKCLKLTSEEIIQTIKESGLRGRGGAGFPSYIKWEATSKEIASQKYIICNADEGEPGTFKDRPLMEQLPFQYIEGVMIAAKAIGSSKAYIYIRGEYTNSIKATILALKELEVHNFLGKNILNSGFDLEIIVANGAGSYLCGEELTLIESLEGKRGNPRIKPPFPAQKGFNNLPTLVNNVETLACVPKIFEHGVEYFKKLGTEKSTGTKVFSVSGDVQRPGYYEVELGTPLSFIVNDLAGGLRNGKKALTYLLGGAAGTFVHPDEIDSLIMDYDSLKEKSYTLGSGAIMVFDEDKKIYDILYSIIKFFVHETCGKCVPCRVGNTQLRSLMKEMQISDDKESFLNKMLVQSELMSATSLCPLGQSPILPIKSAIKNLKEKF